MLVYCFCICIFVVLLCLMLFAADIISCVEYNSTGELLATGDKGGRIVIFQQEHGVSNFFSSLLLTGCDRNFLCQALLLSFIESILG